MTYSKLIEFYEQCLYNMDFAYEHGFNETYVRYARLAKYVEKRMWSFNAVNSLKAA